VQLLINLLTLNSVKAQYIATDTQASDVGKSLEWATPTPDVSPSLLFDTPVISSTFLLTLLLMVGLFFFIRGSIKERTQQIKLMIQASEEEILQQLQDYFSSRAYQLASVDAEQHQVVFEGTVRPSWFLAIFLSVLATIGLLCLILVLSFLHPSESGANWFLGLILLGPAAGAFYWRGAKRLEKVFLKTESLLIEGQELKTLAIVTAHRDELAELQKAFPWELAE
jgi:Cofactor assembly of complex C subunit B